MPNLSLVDYAFLLTETADSPKHVAGLQIFRPPPDYAGDYVSDLASALRERPPGPPFNMRFSQSLMDLPSWIEDEHFDIAYHLRRSRLARPGSRRQLMELVGRLHSILLDRQRPLWEAHLIEGLEDGCFALYSKIHHAYCDGATLVRIMQTSLNRSAQDPTLRASWEARRRPVYRRTASGLADQVNQSVNTLRASVGTALELTGMAGRMAMQRLGVKPGRLPIPFTAPRTGLNTTVSRARRVAVGALPLADIIAFAKRTETTVNDVVVTICDIALSRYLREREGAPAGPLVAQMPVSLRRDGNEEMGNQVAILPVTLGHDGQDPVQRLHQVSRSTAEVKEEALALSPAAVSTYTLMIQGVAQAGEMLGINESMPPQGSILISNVPGPSHSLYLWGAELVHSYPLSAIPPGMSMNITVFGYRDRFDVGLIAGYDAIPDIEVLPRYMTEAFAALQSAAERDRKRSHPAGRKRRRPASSATAGAGTRTHRTRSSNGEARSGQTKSKKKTGGPKRRSKTTTTATRTRKPRPATEPSPDGR